MVTIVQRLAADPDVRAIVINQAVPGSVPAIDRLLEERDDIFIMFSNPQEDPPAVSSRAHLTLNPDNIAFGPRLARQAYEMGATTFIHYSFPRHMSQPLLAMRRNMAREHAETLGLEFHDMTAPDPMGEGGLPATQQFILEDIPRMVERFGPNTAFFGTNCGMQIPLIASVVDTGAIYPSPCCPSPFHGFPAALGIEVAGDYDDIGHVVAETVRIAGERGMLGRMSTWPVPAAMLYTHVGVEYAIRWINGEVPADTIDMQLLHQLTAQYIYETVGQHVGVNLTPYEEHGQVFDNFILLIMDFLVYE
jgi:hypothetical protein